MSNQLPDSVTISKARYWLTSFAMAAVVMAVLVVYSLIAGQRLSEYAFNKLFALDAMILIGFSFALAALGYFFDIFDNLVSYRKYIGLVGFYLVAVHLLFSFIILNDAFPLKAYYLSAKYIDYFIMGLASFLILLMMTGISNNRAVLELGGKNWRRLLRLGYIAYVFALIHYIGKNAALWEYWVKNIDTLPPLNLLVTVYAVFILGLRLTLEISLYYDRKVRLK